MQYINILIACEESQRVCTAFREKDRRIKTFSCDVLPCSGGHPEWHIQGDVLPLLNGNCEFQTQDGQRHKIDGEWDLIIAHPPCTFLTVAANKLYDVSKYGDKALKRLQDRERAIEFFMRIVYANCRHKAIENPIGVMSTRYRKPDQIIQPYQYGHPVRKSTCLWLFGLPPLTPTEIVDFECIHSNGQSGGYSGNLWVVRDESGKILPYGDPRVSVIRSKTYHGVAKAMADQWYPHILSQTLNLNNDINITQFDVDDRNG